MFYAAASPPPTGPCSPDNVTIAVNSVADISTRKLHNNSTTVILEFHTNLTVTSPLVINASFVCTILQPSLDITDPIWITAATDAFNPLWIKSTNNVLVQGINFHIPFNNSPNSTAASPAVRVEGSWAIEMRKVQTSVPLSTTLSVSDIMCLYRGCLYTKGQVGGGFTKSSPFR